MDKSKILLVGCGKTGNVLVNEMMKLDARYTGLFVNSEYNDMASLEKFSPKAAFVFNNANGSGKNRDVAKSYLSGQLQSLVDKIVSYPLHEVITIFTSADGGTGSGITPSLISIMNKVFESKNLSKKINLVAVMPNCDDCDETSLNNSISFWNEIMTIREGYLDDVKFIDNTRGSSYSEINKSATIALNNANTMKGNDAEIGEIDDNDAARFNCSKGFGVVITLPDGAATTNRAIEKALSDSVFALPGNYEADYVGISLKKTSKGTEYKLSEIKSFFNSSPIASYMTTNPKHTTIVLGGCDAPKDIIDMIVDIKKDLETKRLERASEKSDLRISTGENKSNKEKSRKEKKESFSAVYSDDDVMDLANDMQDLLSNLF